MEELSASPEKSFSRSYVLSKNYIVAGERRLDWWIKERHAHCEQASKLSGVAERKSPPSPPSSSTITPPPGAQETFKARHASKGHLSQRQSDEAILKC